MSSESTTGGTLAPPLLLKFLVAGALSAGGVLLVPRTVSGSGDVPPVRMLIETAVIVSESFARRYFGREPAVGRRFDAQFGKRLAPNEVVGVVADVRYDLRKPPAPTIYMLAPLDRFKTIHVRVADDATMTAARLRP